MCLPLPLSCAQLNLSFNKLGPEGAKVLAPAIAVCASLTKILVSCNHLGEEGTKAICEALKVNQSIKELDLSGHPALGSNIGGPAGAKHVADMLCANASITSVC